MKFNFERPPSPAESKHRHDVANLRQGAIGRRMEFETKALALGMTQAQIDLFLEYFALADHVHTHHASDVVPYFTSEPIR